MSDLDEVIKEFLVESNENLDQLDQDLLALEQDPTGKETLANIFRTIHTIKGTCGFLSFTTLESVTHVGESLLSRLRDGQLELTPDMTTALLSMVDAVRRILTHIEASGQEGPDDFTVLIDTLTRLKGGDASTVETNAPTHTATVHESSQDTPCIGEILTQMDEVSPQQIQVALQKQEGGDPRRLGEILVEGGEIEAATIRDALQTQEEMRRRSVSENTIRVNVDLLDSLMNLVGELVLTRNQILQYTAAQEDAALVATGQHLNLVTTELQENVMKTRMQPIGNIWGKFPRIVRDLALSCGKQIRIEMEGKETELDKTLIEAIKDPLTHVVRNAVDHGIEPPEVRAAQGKVPEGCLNLRAFHEGGQVNIEITDDGVGIDPERVKQKALQRGLIAAEQAGRMSECELLNLIFTPGFSTAEQVTNVSGRGVGMDVVKTNIEKIGGSVDIQSIRGTGTTLKIKIPLTLAIIPALIITSGNGCYAIPQVNLLELVRLEGEQARTGIETIHGTPVHRLRGRLLPLVDLNRELRLAQPTTDGKALHTGTRTVNIVVLQADDRQFGLVVDDINDTEEIVVKPLSKQLKGLTVFAGATIMGDGKVALILDVLGIAQRAHVIVKERDLKVVDQANPFQECAEARQLLLLIGVGNEGRVAIPLSTVARLEEIPRDTVEKAGGRDVVQYRGQILPLLTLSSALPTYSTSTANDQELLQVVVYTEDGRSMGLVVDRILDVVEESLRIRHQAGNPGILGSVVIQERVTDLLDVHSIIRSVDPTFFERPTTVAMGE